MAGSRNRFRPVLVGATVLALLGGGSVLAHSLSHHRSSRAEIASPTLRSTAATSRHRFSAADYAAAPVVALPRLPASAAKGHIALPWRRLAVNHAHLTIVFASRPSCEQVNGVVIERSARSVTLDVLATNIVNAPNCDVVPKLKRTVVTLAAPVAARSLRHAPLDASYWPTNPFDET